jgi:hypothetical protein
MRDHVSVSCARSITRRPKHILALLCTLVASTLSANAAMGQTLLSQATWGGPGTDAPNGTAVAADGSAYVVGITDSFTTDIFGQPSASIFLVKYAPDGSLAWQRTWNGPTFFGSFQGPAVALGPEASVYVTGTTSLNGGDAFLLKFDANGNLIWQRTWGGSAFDQGAAVATGPDGSIYVVGTTSSFGPSSFHLFVLKFDPAGALVWQKVSDSNNGMAVAVGPDGSVYAAGTTPRPDGIGEFDLTLLKLDPNGNAVWSKTFAAGVGADPRGGMTVAADGSVYVAGAIQAEKSSFVDIAALVVRLGLDGSLLFARQWGGKSGDTAAGVAAAPDGTVYVAGTSGSFGAGINDAFLIHMLPSGKAADAVTWGGSGIDNGAGVGVAGDGTVVLSAIASSPPYSFQGAPRKTATVKGTLADRIGSLDDAAGTVLDPGVSVTTPSGSTTYAGSVDAALVRIAP